MQTKGKTWYSTFEVNQISCSDPNRAPDGCTEYYFGETKGMVDTYNFNNRQGHQLANQAQTICVRSVSI